MSTRFLTRSLLFALAASTLLACGGPTETNWEPVESPTSGVDIEAVHFDDQERGWLAASGDLGADRGAWYTSDGGETWEQRHAEYDALVARFAADGQTTWLGGRGEAALLRSTDNDAFTPRTDDLGDDPAVLYFWDDQTGLVGSDSAARIHRTTDGGDSFTSMSFDEVTSPEGIHDIAVRGDRVWVATGPMSTSDDSGRLVLYSDDRGQSWETIEFQDDARGEGGAIMAVHPVDATTIWAAGRNGQLYVTRDGMGSWDQIPNVPEEVRHFEAMDGVGETLMAAGSGESREFIFQSTDGGESWDGIFFEGDGCSGPCKVDGIEVVSSNLAYAYGPADTLLRYEK